MMLLSAAGDLPAGQPRKQCVRLGLQRACPPGVCSGLPSASCQSQSQTPSCTLDIPPPTHTCAVLEYHNVLGLLNVRDNALSGSVPAW